MSHGESAFSLGSKQGEAATQLVATKTAFRVKVATDRCADLKKPPFSEFENEISSPTSYSVSQRIGDELRTRNTLVIRFRSARCVERGANIAITHVQAFQEKTLSEATTWFCVSSEDSVEFKPVGFQAVTLKRTVFKKSDFQASGGLLPGKLSRL
jgi:RES domain